MKAVFYAGMLMMSLLLTGCEIFVTPARSTGTATRTPARKPAARPTAGGVAAAPGKAATVAGRPEVRMTRREDYNPQAVRYSSRIVSDLINTARSYGGTGYRTGGGTSGGLDCSGLVQVSFRQIGIKLPRRAAEQAGVGPEVAVERLRPGDLLFFQISNAPEINHTGIVTVVRPDAVFFIHASTSRGVIEDNLYATYWSDSFVRATRLLD